MSEPKFTKGPWENVKTHSYYNLGVTEHYYDVYEIKDANDKIITKLDAEGMEKDKNIKDNAALIATAPEMYVMLEQLVEAVKTLNKISLIKINDKLIEDAVNIIKKAQGEE